MNAVKNEIEILVQKELKSANEHFPPFNSAHEGYAILLEEIDELKENTSWIEDYVSKLWTQVKQNQVHTADTKSIINCIEHTATLAAAEAIQVAAMCEKFNVLLYYERIHSD